MNTAHSDPNVAASPMEDDLSKLQLEVAHRADELWRREGKGRGSDIVFWLRAEREVIEERLFAAGAGMHGFV
jgi:hypothetical protein